MIDIWNTSKLDDFVLGNLRLGITSDNWDAMLYVNNVGNDDTVLTANSNPGDVVQSIFSTRPTSRPRTRSAPRSRTHGSSASASTTASAARAPEMAVASNDAAADGRARHRPRCASPSSDSSASASDS